jgi:molecular chaperone GrpE
MSDSQSEPHEPVIKINDRRRVTEEGDVNEAAAAPAVNPELERLTTDLETARRRVNELAHALQAGERDREEFKQRQNRERERMIDVEKGNVANTLLEAVDQLDLVLQAADDSPLAKGVKLIRDTVLKQAETTGIERIELVGGQYDPNLAEATDMEITPVEADDGKVVSVFKVAYQLKGRVIRPGVVKVAKYVKPANA